VRVGRGRPRFEVSEADILSFSARSRDRQASTSLPPGAPYVKRFQEITTLDAFDLDPG
jgi:hypothetical protein